MIFRKNTMINTSLLIKADGFVNMDRLEFVEARLGDLIVNKEFANESVLEVLVSPNQLSLRSPLLDERATIGVCFHEGAANHRRLYGGGKSQHLAKAVGIDQGKGLKVVDATAGLAGDSFVLASLGAQVQMLERSPVLALMIEDALAAAKKSGAEDFRLQEIIERMSIVQVDAVDWLARQAGESCDVVFLDPMFPERKKKAAVKKEMQVLQHLLAREEKSETERLEEEAELLEISLSKAIHRVVVKRPRHAPSLTGKSPGYCLEGKSTRFDIYPLKRIG